MTRRKRWYHSPEFKAMVTIASSRGDRTQAELSQQFEVHVRPDKDLKAQQPERSAVEFEAKLAKESGPDIQTMQTKIGQLQNRVLLTTES